MRKLEREHGVAEAARGLSLEALQRKLTTLASLFRFDRWDETANAAYESLFNVDMVRARGKRDAYAALNFTGPCGQPVAAKPRARKPRRDGGPRRGADAVS